MTPFPQIANTRCSILVRHRSDKKVSDWCLINVNLGVFAIWASSQYKDCLIYVWRFSMLKIRRPLGRLIFNMGIAIPGKTVFLIETAPWVHALNRIWWLCLVPISTTRFVSDLYRMVKKLIGLYKEDAFYPRPVLAFGYCRCLRLSVCVSVCASITCLSAR